MGDARVLSGFCRIEPLCESMYKRNPEARAPKPAKDAKKSSTGRKEPPSTRIPAYYIHSK